MDIACIDQLDAGKKAAGIASLGALLDRSDRMVVLFDEHYMTRMWCVFELAAFAKRGSLDRMDIVPLHIALIKGACLTVLVLMNFPMLYVNNSMDSLSMPFYICITIFFFGPCFAFVMIADNRGRAARQAIEKLRDFKLSDASCASTADRDAIIALIGRWWADDHWRADEDGDSQAHGIHSFEQFVRIEMRRKLEETLGSSSGLFAGSGWPMDVKIIFLLWLGGAWNLDMISDPGATLYHVVSMLANSIFGLFIPVHLLTGLLSAIAAGARAAPAPSFRGQATRRCRCGEEQLAARETWRRGSRGRLATPSQREKHAGREQGRGRAAARVSSRERRQRSRHRAHGVLPPDHAARARGHPKRACSDAEQFEICA